MFKRRYTNAEIRTIKKALIDGATNIEPIDAVVTRLNDAGVGTSSGTPWNMTKLNNFAFRHGIKYKRLRAAARMQVKASRMAGGKMPATPTSRKETTLRAVRTNSATNSLLLDTLTHPALSDKTKVAVITALMQEGTK